MRLRPVRETSFVPPSVAAALSRFRPVEILDLASGSGLADEPPPVRSAIVGRHFMVHLGDVLSLSAVCRPIDRAGDDIE